MRMTLELRHSSQKVEILLARLNPNLDEGITIFFFPRQMPVDDGFLGYYWDISHT